jgi:cellulose synthase/poly-beta-1,6-N-acetylglucosamine synthase-like glycosyltransferase
MRNLKELNYPRTKLQIVFVDSGSRDGTAELLEKMADIDLNIEIVRQSAREGYNRAVIEGFRKTSGDVISITGAETEFRPNTLLEMAKHFLRTDVGAVTGRQLIRNPLGGLSPELEVAYRDIYDLIREAESKIDSPFDIKGEVCAARREVVSRIVGNSRLVRKGCVDGCFSFQSRMLGLRTVYEPDAVYYEDSPYSLRESFAQQIRRAATLIESMFVFTELMFKKRYGKFGLVIMPAHFAMLIIMPFVFALLIASLVLSAATNLHNLWAISILATGVVGTIFSKHVQAFVKAQISLLAANIGLLKGLDTQRFRRLPSTRTINRASGRRQLEK